MNFLNTFDFWILAWMFLLTVLLIWTNTEAK